MTVSVRSMSPHIMSRLFMFITLQHIEIIFIHAVPGAKRRRRKHDILIQLDLCVTHLSFSLLPHLSVASECLSPCLSPPCQTGALTRGCWSKWKRWSCRASLQQRPGICKVLFNCSARQLSSCLGEPQLITTEHRPCGCEGTQRVPATDSTVNHSKRHGVRHVRRWSLSPATPRQPPSCQPQNRYDTGGIFHAASHCGGRVT